MKKTIVILLITLVQLSTVYSQDVIHLYDGKAPGSGDWSYKEVEFTCDEFPHGKSVRNVVDPTLEVFLPKKSEATEEAIIICPGGGNFYLEYEKEGTQIAEWLVKKGITAFVLKYRLDRTPDSPEEYNKYVTDFRDRINSLANSKEKTFTPPVSKKNYGGEDGIRALEYIRQHAEEYNINPSKVGIMGFSAGASVSLYVILNSPPEKQPDFAGLIYGGWIKDSEVPENAPPIFIACADDDPIATNSPDLYKAWKLAGKSAELHIYSLGGHGFGLTPNELPVSDWIERFYEWLKVTDI